MMSVASEKKRLKKLRKSKAAKRKRNIAKNRPKKKKDEAVVEEVSLDGVIDEIIKEGDMIESGEAEIGKYSLPIPEQYQAPIREAEREMLHAKSMKDLKAVAKKYGVTGVSKFKKDQRADIESMIREKVGMEIGAVIFQHKMSEMSETEEERTLGSMYQKMITERNESLTQRRKVRACDCIPVWMESLKEFPDEHKKILEKHDVFMLLGEDATDEGEESKVWESDQVADLLQDLFATLCNLAPEGKYFGSDERRDGEWGFWDHYIADTKMEEEDIIDVDVEETAAKLRLVEPLLEEANG
jgi:hypothetical protein